MRKVKKVPIEIILRHDTIKISSEYEADNVANSGTKRYRQYKTAVKVGDKWVVTNKYDPRCDDKTTPVTPGYHSYEQR